jgi:hypothetical protein
MLPIVFYFPYPSVGGVSVLFLRLAQQLLNSRDVIIMDLEDGYMATHLPDGCQFIKFDQPQLLPQECVVVFQSIPLWRIKQIDKFPASAYLFFWNLHPYNLSPHLISSNPRVHWLKPFVSLINIASQWRKKRLLQTCNMMLRHESLVFMDIENRNATSKLLHIDLSDAHLLPITTSPLVGNSHVLAPQIVQEFKVIKLVWLGRLEGFKIPILLHTISRLDDILGLELTLDIIGKGVEQDVIVEAASKTKNLTVKFKEEVPFHAVEQALSRYHILLAMGTSALEGAKIGLPTFCLDYSYKKVEGMYRFRLLRNCSGYNVAEEINQSHIELVSTLEKQIKSVIINFESESQAVQHYWKVNHSPESVVRQFLQFINHASFSFNDVLHSNLHKMDFMTALIVIFDWRKSEKCGFINR